MANAGEVRVKVTLNTRVFVRELHRLGDSYERYDARRSGSWNRYQMVGAR